MNTQVFPLNVLTPIYEALTPKEQQKVLEKSGITSWPPTTTFECSQVAIAMGRNDWGNFDQWKPPTEEEIKELIIEAIREYNLFKREFIDKYFGPAYGKEMSRFSITITQEDFIRNQRD